MAVETARVAVKERELAAARAALASAESAHERALSRANQAQSRWIDVETSSETLARASEHRRSLDAEVQVAAMGVARAAALVKSREEAAIAARMAERRFELLIEGIDAAEDVRARKAERKAGDEHAARKGITS
jgi:hypothetical protein